MLDTYFRRVRLATALAIGLPLVALPRMSFAQG